MDLDVFKAQYVRLLNEFGAENFGAEKAKLMWAEYQSPELSNKDAIKIFDWAIGYYQKKFPPTATQMINEAKRAISHFRAEQAKLNKQPEDRRYYNTDALSQCLKSLGHNSVQELLANNFKPKKNG